MLDDLRKTLRTEADAVDNWFQNQWQNLTPPLYLSCDIRHSGVKIAAIDSNLFPAGFNNLCKAYSEKAADGFKHYFKTYYPHVSQIALFAEDHTRNKFYLKNLHRLCDLLTQAGLKVRIGIEGAFLKESQLSLELDPESITLHQINQDDLSLNGFQPDLILSNNDFSAGVPAYLQNASLPIIPAPDLGWHKRRKGHHFALLNDLAADFGQKFNIDPWQLTAFSQVVHDVDLTNSQSVEQMASAVDQMIAQIQAKYDEYELKEDPYVYLKNNSGTYGMGILPVFSGDDVLAFNRRKKNKLLSAKSGETTTEFLIQEGIRTVDTYSEYPLEPVIYAVGNQPIGGFFRIHESKNEFESLNAPGMSFSCLCLHKLDEDHEKYFIQCKEKASLVFLANFVTRLASLAASQEKSRGSSPRA